MPQLTIADNITLELIDCAATRQFGADCSIIAEPGDVFALIGDLGAGKTEFARGFIRHNAGDSTLEVPSPTFSITQPYEGRLSVSHFDFYRLADAEEIRESGFEDDFDGRVSLVEWPQRAANTMPAHTVWLRFADGGGDARRVTIAGTGPVVERVRRSLAIRALIDTEIGTTIVRAPLAGDASARRYERLANHDDPLVVMDMPDVPDGPAIRDGLAYSRLVALAENITPYIALTGLLRSNGYHAPRILAADQNQGILVLEDLGSNGIADKNGQPIAERYLAAIELLADMHARSWPQTVAMQNGTTHTIADYHQDALITETQLLIEWFVEHHVGRPPDNTMRRQFVELWRRYADHLTACEQTLVLRDFHSPNLLWCKAETGHRRLGLIDFQDAVIGPAAYDVASLAQDARVTVTPELERRLIEQYVLARSNDAKFDNTAFTAIYPVMAAQRLSKLFGIFVRLHKRDGKAGYLRHMPRLVDYMARNLRAASLADYRQWFATYLGMYDDHG